MYLLFELYYAKYNAISFFNQVIKCKQTNKLKQDHLNKYRKKAKVHLIFSKSRRLLDSGISIHNSFVFSL